MPPHGAPQSFIEVGAAQGSYFSGIPTERKEQLELRMGHSRRITDRLSVRANAVLREDGNFIETGVRARLGKTDWTGVWGGGSGGERAWTLSARARLRTAGLSASLSRVETGYYGPAGYSAFLRAREDYWLVSASASRRIGEGHLTLNAFGRDGSLFGRSHSVWLGYDRPVFRKDLRLSTEIQASQSETRVGLRLTRSLNFPRARLPFHVARGYAPGIARLHNGCARGSP